jgi:hypothetical protein
MSTKTKAERKFQADLIAEIKDRFPGCMVLKNDANYIQGIPDLTVLYGEHWATLECKKSANAPARPNQPFYVEKMNEMSFSRFIFPENKKEVLNELEQSFQAHRRTRVSGSKQIFVA